ncbi:MAG: hypothetical protein JRK53_09020, partial [Deltaproteobacteria bacterium]|nr:hypothetical protein [Deltaproteobacteria bacterium]
MKPQNRFHTLLIFPPVWTPVTPYLALPLLVAYLREKGFSVAQYDAGLAFFDRFLLMPETLSGLLGNIFERAEAGHYASLPEDKRLLLDDIRENRAHWEGEIARVRRRVESLRHGTDFYDPEACIRAQKRIYDLLSLVSLAVHPTSFTFNTFSNPSHTNFKQMAKFCDDSEANPFLAFYARRLPEVMETHTPSLVGISISTSHQLAGALSMARFIKGRYPSVHVTLGGKHCLRLMESFFESPGYFNLFCDSMIVDNGERPLEILIRRLSTGGDPGGVPNLIRHHGGRLKRNETMPHEPIGDLPTPDFSDLPLESYYSPEPILPMRLSEGCYWGSEGCYWGKCTFCSRYDNRRFQTVRPDVAADQMEALQRQYGARCFTINDDCLTPTYLEDLSRIIIARGLNPRISLWCKP